MHAKVWVLDYDCVCVCKRERERARGDSQAHPSHII